MVSPRLKPFVRYLALTLLLASQALSAVAAEACSARSGKTKTVLLELYTSEGCSSCPPADRFLATLPNRDRGLDRVVPLAFHVPYWDYIGWKDAFAHPAYAERHAWLVARNGRRTVYTPHFFVSGKAVLNWQSGLDQEIARVTAAPSTASIELAGILSGKDAVTLTARVTSSARDAAQNLFLAVTESGIISAVHAGENQGATLGHDHVVRLLLGPFPVSGGILSTQHEIALDPGWQRSQLRLAGFLQNADAGRIHQAVATDRCNLAR
ncbi:MAG: DUF1223 domain-containing protein [Gammaproteobacteria bacterium]|nr:DUF1223 domain-containing protein [Gammaproteobacteria bacterium]MBU1647322.1 DUF1223 domain-containing protein [Gammaproteobacteria bacterium]MBU1973114.1 DUF1223 domain-containing protein [Gammaproteobacteria bacterium]